MNKNVNGNRDKQNNEYDLYKLADLSRFTVSGLRILSFSFGECNVFEAR